MTLDEFLVTTYQPDMARFLLEMSRKLKGTDPLIIENVASSLDEAARKWVVHNKLKELARILLDREVEADFEGWVQQDSNGIQQSYLQVTLYVKGQKSAHCPILPASGRMTPPIMRQCFTDNGPTNLDAIMKIVCSSMIYLEANPEFRLNSAIFPKRKSILNLTA
jgi:hypothetical protein